MPKISVVDISDSDKIQEILNDDDSITVDNTLESDAESDESDDSELGVVPRLLFSTFSTLTILIPLVSTHIALDMIVHQQYAEDFDVVEIAMRAGTAALGIQSQLLSNEYSTVIFDRRYSSTEGSANNTWYIVLCISCIRGCDDSSK